jgi:hypothetical protein
MFPSTDLIQTVNYILSGTGLGPTKPGSSQPVTVTANQGVTLSKADVLAPILIRNGNLSEVYTDTTPTAAQLVAALPGVQAGAQRIWLA